LIKIDSSSHLIEDDIIMEILTMANKDGNYILPINNYITDIYDSTEDKKYKIIVDEEDFKKNDEILVEFIPDCNRITIDKDDKSIIMKNITDNNGIVQKFRIKKFNNDFTLKVIVPKDISFGNYIIRYYFTEEEREQYYKLNKIFTKIKGNQKNDIILKFNKFEITNNNNNAIKGKLFFKIYGFLYEDENEIKNVFINSSQTFKEKIFKNYTFIQKDSDFSLYFSRVKSKNKNNLFNLQMKIVVFLIDNIFNEEFFVYKLPVNLDEELKEEFPLIWVLIISSLALVIIIIIIGFTIGYIKLKNKNSNLKEKVLAISFTSGTIDDEIAKKKSMSRSDEDYENTFI
jgi:hypothetical protein